LCYCHDVHPSVCLSVCPSGTGMHCDHTVHVSTDLSLWLDSLVFWEPWHQSMSTYSQPSFSSSTWKGGEVWVCKLCVIFQERLKIEVRLLLSADRSHICHDNWHNNRWPWMAVSSASCTIFVIAELLVNVCCKDWLGNLINTVCLLVLLCDRTLEVATCSQFTHNGFQALTRVSYVLVQLLNVVFLSAAKLYIMIC